MAEVTPKDIVVRNPAPDASPPGTATGSTHTICLSSGHREAALTTAQAEAAALKQRIAVLEKVIREVGRKAWCNPDSLTCQEIEALVVPLLSEKGNG